VIKKDGSIIWVKDFTTIIRDEEGNIVDLLGYFIDITDKKRVEIEYENIQNMFSAIWQAIDVEAYIVHNTGKILFSNNQDLYSLKDLLKKDIYIFENFSILSQWADILEELLNSPNKYIKRKSVIDNEITFKISKIDNERLLILSNIKK
jgi:hypothetical protein